MNFKLIRLRNFLSLLILGFLVCATVSAQMPKFKNIANIHVGEEAAAEIVAYSKNTQTLWVLNSPNSTIDAYDFANPAKPILKYLFDYSGLGGEATSVAAYGDYIAVALRAEVKQDAGKIIVLNAADATILKEFTAGALPDMLTFSHDGTYIVAANEGEPNDAYDNDPEGTVTVIKITGGLESATVAHANFQFFNDKKAYLRGIGVRIQDNAGQTVAQDLEPEYLTITDDNTTAFVTLQENNAVAKVDLATATVTDILPLGYKEFSKGTANVQNFVLNENANWSALGTPAYGTETPTVMLGGFSGLCYDQHQSTSDVSVFWAVPDRGPNDAPVKNVEGAAGELRPYKLPDYQARMVKFSLNHSTGVISFDPADQVMLVAKDGTTPISGRPNVEGKDEVPVTYLDSEIGADYVVGDKYYKKLAYDAYGGDFEGIISDAAGNFWMCDENRPSIYKFAANGTLMERYVPQGTAAIGGDAVGTYGAETLPANYNNRRANRGFEGIAYDEANGIIYAFIQSAMYNPTSEAKTSDVIRILGISVTDGTPVSEYVYLLERNSFMGTATSAVDKIGDACYVGDGKMIVIERDSKGLNDNGSKKYIYEIDLLGATNILADATARLDAGETLELMSADEIVAAGIQPVYKRKVLNLPSIGYLPSDKVEGLALLPNGQMAVVNDNDFGVAGAGETDNTVLGIISFDNNYKLSTSDKVATIALDNHPILGTLMPDAVSSYTYNGVVYYVTANEGDGREYGDFADEERIGKLDLNTERFPYAATLQENEQLGRLKSILCPTWDDLNNDGNMDNLFVMGGRSFSIFDEFGNLVYDSGSELAMQTIMNSPQGKSAFRSRSDDKGVEPEAITIGEINGKMLAFIGLERMNAVMVYDVTDPMKVEFVQYINDFDYYSEEGNESPEGFVFIAAEDSPTGKPLFVTGYETSGTVGVYAMDEVTQNANFMVISDLHYLDPSLIDSPTNAEFLAYLARDRKMLAESDEILEAMKAKILEEAPAFLLVPGDLTKDGEAASHAGVAAMFTELENAGIEVFVAPGNHDINNPHAVAFVATDSKMATESVTPAEFASVYGAFGYANAEESDVNSLSYLEKFDGATDYWVLSLDVCHYDNNIVDDYPETAGSIKPATLTWVLDIFAKAKTEGKQVITMMHHGMLEHYDMHATFLGDYVISDWQDVSEQLADAGMKVVFTGHSHAQDITRKITRKGNVISDVQTGSLVTYPSPYRLVEIIDNETLKISGGKLEEVEGISTDFQDYALTYINNGFPDLVKYMLMGAPVYLPEPYAEALKMPFTRAYVAHYHGDEQFMPAGDEAVRDGLLADPATAVLGMFLNSVWTDLASNDWYNTIDLNEKYNEKFDLTIFHNNDGESKLLGVEDESTGLYGTVGAFKAKLDRLRSQLENESVTLSSGDNFLAGPQFNAGLNNPGGIYDALAMSQIGYDAICIGNHDFDFGPDVLADFISDFNRDIPFLSCNLDFSNEPNLQALVDAGKIAPSKIIEKDGIKVGVVGATTPSLDYVSSPRNTIINDDVAGAVQAAVDALTAQGIDKIVLISHLQDIDEEKTLVASLRDVDVVIAGGGDELLGEEGVSVFPGDGEFYDTYPIVVKDIENKDVYVVTTPGEYKYVGRLDVNFNELGEVTEVGDESGLYLVRPETCGFDASLRVNAEEPVQAALATYQSNVIAISEVDLDGTRANIRAIETNLGDLVADAMLWQANQLNADFGVAAANIAIVGGGGIRNNTVIPAGAINELHTFNILPFSNFVAIVDGVTAADLKEVLENSVSAMEGGLNSGSGRFLQVAGIDIVWNTEATSIEYDGDGNVVNGNAGERIFTATLSDGTPIVVDGVVSATAPNVNIALPDFTARGGDQFTFGEGKTFTTLGVTYQQALYNYLVDGISGQITAASYPVDGMNRIIRKGTSTSINISSRSTKLKVYPVPAVDYVNFELPVEGKLVITNMSGAVALQKDVVSGVNTVNVSQLHSGVYVYTVNTKNGKYQDMMVVK